MSEIGNRLVYPAPLDFRDTDAERHEVAVREVSEVLTGETEDGQRLSYLHVNRDFETEPPIICIGSMFVDSGMAELKYAAYQRAATFPDRSILLLDLPAHGQSDALTDAQYSEITVSRGLTRVARAEAEIAKRRLPDITQTVVYGESVGARVALDFAQKIGEIGVEPLAVLGVEAIGLEKRLSVSVSGSYFLAEPRMHQVLYRDKGDYKIQNSTYEAAFQDFKAELTRAVNFDQNILKMQLRVFKTDPRYITMLFSNSPLAADTGRQSLETLLEDQPKLPVRLVVGGLSRICRWRHIHEWAENLQANQPERLRFDVWPYDSHGVALAPQQPRLTATLKEVIGNLTTQG